MKQPFKWRFFTSQSRLRLFSDFSFRSIFGRWRFRHSWWLIVFWRCTAHLVLIWRQVISKHCYNKDFTQLTLLKNMTWLCSAHGFSFAAPASYATVKQFGQADVIFNWASILLLTLMQNLNFCTKIQFWWNLHQHWIWIFPPKMGLLITWFCEQNWNFATVCYLRRKIVKIPKKSSIFILTRKIQTSLLGRPFGPPSLRFRQKYETFWMTFSTLCPMQKERCETSKRFPSGWLRSLLFTKMRKYRKEHLRLLEKMTHFDLRLHLF